MKVLKCFQVHGKDTNMQNYAELTSKFWKASTIN